MNNLDKAIYDVLGSHTAWAKHHQQAPRVFSVGFVWWLIADSDNSAGGRPAVFKSLNRLVKMGALERCGLAKGEVRYRPAILMLNYFESR